MGGIGTTAFISPTANPGIMGLPQTEVDYYNYSLGLDLSGAAIDCPAGFAAPFMNGGDTYEDDNCNG